MAADIDECYNGNNTCALNATCTNTEGSYNCSCNLGYTGNGENCTSKEISYMYFIINFAML